MNQPISARNIVKFWIRNPGRILLLLVEILCIGMALWAAVQPPIAYEFTAGELLPVSEDLALDYDEKGYYGAVSSVERQDILRTPDLSLAAGKYQATVEYHIENTVGDNGVRRHSGIQLKDSQNGPAVSDSFLILMEDTGTDTVTLTVWQQTDTASVRFVDDSGIFTVGSIRIVQDMTFAASMAAVTVLCCLALDLAVLGLAPSSPLFAGSRTAIVWIVLGCTVLFASAPILVDGVCLVDDARFHLIRIEGIAQALRNGQFPVRINPIAKDGYGYATSMFYGELFLYFPAVLRLLGVSVQGAYQTFVAAVHLLTAVISYRSFRPILGRRIALAGAVLYTLSPYRLHRLYDAAAVGEFLAMAFLPAVVYGLWLIYRKEADKASRAKAGFVLALAFTALLQSHMINTEIAVMATAVFCLIYWRVTFRREVLFTWGKAVVLAVLLNLWFLVSFATAMTSGLYHNIAVTNIQWKGQTILALLNINDKFSIGASVLLCGGIAVLALYAVRDMPARWKKAGGVAFAFGAAGVVLSTRMFPWNAVEKLPFGNLLTVIQFPWRYTTLATLGLILAFLFVIKGLTQTGHARWTTPLLTGTAVVAACCVLVYWSSLDQSILAQLTDTSQLAYDSKNIAYDMDTLYLPDSSWETGEGMDVSNPFTDVETGEFVRDGSVISVEYQETQGYDGHVEFPLLYYPGYTVVEGEGTVVLSTNGMVGVVVPPNSSGTLAVAFREPKRWLLADLVSLAAALGMAGCSLHSRRRKKARASENRELS